MGSTTSGPAARRHKLLLMSVGSLVGTAVLECLESLGRERFELIGTNSEAGALNNFRMDVCHLAPPALQHEALFTQLDELVRRHEPDLIVPTRDDDVVALAHWCTRRGWTRAMVGSPAMADVIRDKWASATWAGANGLPFARSAIDAAGADALRRSVGLPLVAKPRLGFGSNGVRLLLDEQHLAAALRGGDMVLQEPIDPAPMLRPADLEAGMPLWYAPPQPGSALTLCLLDDAGASLQAAWQSQHVRGAAISTVLLQEPALERLALDFAQAAWRDGWRGLMNVQARRRGRDDWVPIELAGRFMGGVNALQALGVPVVARVLQRYLGGFDAAARPAPNRAARAVKQVHTHLIAAADEAALRRHGVWERGAGH